MNRAVRSCGLSEPEIRGSKAAIQLAIETAIERCRDYCGSSRFGCQPRNGRSHDGCGRKRGNTGDGAERTCDCDDRGTRSHRRRQRRDRCRDRSHGIGATNRAADRRGRRTRVDPRAAEPTRAAEGKPRFVPFTHVRGKRHGCDSCSRIILLNFQKFMETFEPRAVTLFQQELYYRSSSIKEIAESLDRGASSVKVALLRKLRSSIVPRNRDLDGAIVGAKRVAGRWPNKGAIEFKRPGDRVRVDIPGEFESLTFACWVKIDSLDGRVRPVQRSSNSPRNP